MTNEVGSKWYEVHPIAEVWQLVAGLATRSPLKHQNIDISVRIANVQLF